MENILKYYIYTKILTLHKNTLRLGHILKYNLYTEIRKLQKSALRPGHILKYYLRTKILTYTKCSHSGTYFKILFSY